MFTLTRTSRFDRRFARFIRRHPELRGRIAQVLRDLQGDPFQPHLRLHPLQGEFEGYHAVSVTFAYRIVLVLRIEAQRIILHDIGGHDEVYL